MSGITGTPGSRSHIIDGIDSTFQTYCMIPFAGTTIGTSNTDMALLNQSSSAMLPRTEGFSVSQDDDFISIAKGGMYFYHVSIFIADNNVSRDNFFNCYIANNATPTTGSNKIFGLGFTNTGVTGSDNYFTVGISGVVTVVANDRIKVFGRAVYATQAISVATAFNRSTFTLIKIN